MRLPSFNIASMFHRDPEGGPGATCDTVTCAHGGQCYLPRVFPRVPACECELTTFTGPTCDQGEQHQGLSRIMKQ